MNKLVIKINNKEHCQPGFHIFDGIKYDSWCIDKVDYTEYIWVRFIEIEDVLVSVPTNCKQNILYGYETFSRRMKFETII